MSGLDLAGIHGGGGRVTGVQANTLRVVTAVRVRASRSREYVVTPALSPEFA